MINIKKDKDYINIVDNILNSEEFHKIKKIEHHGTTRFDHSVRVSYYSYKLARLFRLDYNDVARAGLLHDFFLSDENINIKGKFISTFTHPKKAVENSSRVFGINDKEKNIINSHMFPIYLSLPKYAESWLVSIVDKIVGTYEFSKKFKHMANLYILFLINFIR